MSPRPILKGPKPGGFTVTQPHHHHHHPHHFTQTAHHNQHSVHFPPSPALTRTFLVHSASSYDRSPIVVSPNDCALPERGCPGRTYFEEPSSSPTSRRCLNLMSNTKGYHPRAFSANGLGSNYDLPPLVPDLSSESDESDGVAGLPAPSSVTFGPHGLPSSSAIRAATNNPNLSIHGYSYGYAACDQDAALSFLPYSPSSYPYGVDVQKENLRRRRDKKHESSVDPDRISSGDAHIAQFTHAFSSLSISRSPSPSRSPPSTPKKKSHRRQQSSFTPFSDDGCLGGF